MDWSIVTMICICRWAKNEIMSIGNVAYNANIALFVFGSIRIWRRWQLIFECNYYLNAINIWMIWELYAIVEKEEIIATVWFEYIIWIYNGPNRRSGIGEIEAEADAMEAGDWSIGADIFCMMRWCWCRCWCADFLWCVLCRRWVGAKYLLTVFMYWQFLCTDSFYGP